MSDRPTAGALLDHLTASGRLDAGGRAKVLAWLQSDESRSLPWMLQALMAVGAWFAAIFFVVFFAAGGFLSLREGGFLPIGSVLLIGATIGRRFARPLFLQQFCLAVSLAGQMLILAGVADLSHFRTVRVVAAGSALLAVGLYPLYPDPLHRFLTVGNALFWAVVQIEEMKQPHALHGVVLAETAAVLAVFTRRHTLSAFLPAGYAAAVALPATLMLIAVPEFRFPTLDAPARAILGAALVWAIAWAAGGTLKREPVILAIGATLLVAAAGVGGLLAAGLLLVVGYARWDRALIGLGLAATASFLFVYYYELSATLLEKSAMLTGTGAGMLLIRWYVARRRWEAA